MPKHERHAAFDALGEIDELAQAGLGAESMHEVRAVLRNIVASVAAARGADGRARRAAMTEAEAREIHRLAESGVRAVDIAKACGRHVDTVRDLLRLGWTGYLGKRLAASDRAKQKRAKPLNL